MNDSSDRIAAHLRGLISRSGTGARLPSSRRLVQEHSASPVTVQRAIDVLVREGLVETRPGAGTFVRGRPAQSPADLSWQAAALGPVRTRPPAVRPLAETTADAISFHSGYPADELLPVQLVRTAVTRAARSEAALGRGASAGDPELREWFAGELAGITPGSVRLHERGDVAIVPGSQAGLTSAFRALAANSGRILMEVPTYWGAINAAAQLGLEIVPVASGPGGPDPEEVDRALEARGARAFYAQPDFANPTGGQWSGATKTRVLEVMRSRGAFLIEDDWAHDFGIESSARPVASLDDTGHVVYIRSLTKSVSPALRVAAVMSRGPARERILTDVRAGNLYVSALLQRAALGVVTQSGWRRHVMSLRAQLRQRRDLLLEAVRTALPQAVVDAVPQGALNLWLRLPDDTDPVRLRRDCELAGVVIATGEDWFPGEPTGKHLRLNYASQSPGTYPEAMATVARMLGRQ